MRIVRLPRRIVMILCAAILLSAVSPLIVAPEYRKLEAYACEKEVCTATFPAFLQAVEDEAFYGTSIGTAVFHDGLIHIGERAFLNAPNLGVVYIPDSTEQIGMNAFPDRISFHGIEGSYAQQWAEEHGIEFTADDIWHAKAMPCDLRFEQLLFLLCTIVPVDIRNIKTIRRKTEAFVKSLRPQDRIELNPIDYRFP